MVHPAMALFVTALFVWTAAKKIAEGEKLSPILSGIVFLALALPVLLPFLAGLGDGALAEGLNAATWLIDDEWRNVLEARGYSAVFLPGKLFLYLEFGFWLAVLYWAWDAIARARRENWPRLIVGMAAAFNLVSFILGDLAGVSLVIQLHLHRSLRFILLLAMIAWPAKLFALSGKEGADWRFGLFSLAAVGAFGQTFSDERIQPFWLLIVMLVFFRRLVFFLAGRFGRDAGAALSSSVPVFLAIVLLAAWPVAWPLLPLWIFFKKGPLRGKTPTARAAAAPLIFLAFWSVPHLAASSPDGLLSRIDARVRLPFLDTYTYEKDAGRWIDAHLPREEVLLCGEGVVDLRGRALRTVYFAYDDGGGVIFNRSFAMEWTRRREVAQRVLSARNESILELARREGITLLVLRRPQEARLPLLYENGGLGVYDLTGRN